MALVSQLILYHKICTCHKTLKRNHSRDIYLQYTDRSISPGLSISKPDLKKHTLELSLSSILTSKSTVLLQHHLEPYRALI